LRDPPEALSFSFRRRVVQEKTVDPLVELERGLLLCDVVPKTVWDHPNFVRRALRLVPAGREGEVCVLNGLAQT
jgi:hypothetical protein